MTGKEESKKIIINIDFRERKLGERRFCLLVKDGMSSFIVQLGTCEDVSTVMSTSK